MNTAAPVPRPPPRSAQGRCKSPPGSLIYRFEQIFFDPAVHSNPYQKGQETNFAPGVVTAFGDTICETRRGSSAQAGDHTLFPSKALSGWVKPSRLKRAKEIETEKLPGSLKRSRNNFRRHAFSFERGR